MKRKYTKKNKNYWDSLKRKDTIQPMQFSEAAQNPEFIGDPFYTSSSSCWRGADGTSVNRASSAYSATSIFTEDYTNLNKLSAPFAYGKDGFANIKEPILLCQKAYFYVALFRNTIDVMSELSDDELVVSGGTKASRTFVKKWMESIKVDSLKSQFFREYYRSGNVFLYRMYAEFSPSELAAMKTIYAAKDLELIPQDVDFPKNSLPIKYILLNPMDIVNYESINSTNSYKKVLTKFEAMRLQNPTTQEEKKILENIEKTQKIGTVNSKVSEIYVDLDPSRLIFVFYKKQDYEPFAVPFGFPVLRDINWKLELKNVDKSLLKIYENVMLLITMGNEPDKGGINPRHMEAMKQLFMNETVGRVLVADYTTQAKFVVPQLDSILGKQKYEIVNQDIKEGLQNIFFEEAKYSNSEIKIKVFLEKLKEGRRLFVNEFLQSEVKKICYAMGFRDYPKIKFRSSNVLNETETQKAIMRLIELGLIVPQQGIDSLSRKELPDASEIKEGQQQYIEDRKDGLYSPLVGGPPLYTPEESLNPASSPIAKIPSANGRPTKNSISNDMVSVKAIANIASEISKFEEYAKGELKKQKKIKELSSEQESIAARLCDSIVESTEIKEWKKIFKDCSENLDSITKLITKPEILDISSAYNISIHEASMIYHSKKLKK